LKIRLRLSDLPGTAITPRFVEAISENGDAVGREHLRTEADTLSLTCEQGVFQYRLTGE
jgi:hypothetical protein